MMSVRVTDTQLTVLRRLIGSLPMTAEQLNVRITTLQSMKSKGLVKNLQRFGTESTLGKERKAIRWKATLAGEVFYNLNEN